jgi:8-oxo-dGTP pyrophosphatase MutT (NUDIX family)
MTTTNEVPETVFDAATVLGPIRPGRFPDDQGYLLARTLKAAAKSGEIASPEQLTIDVTRCRPDLLISSFFTAIRDSFVIYDDDLARTLRRARWRTAYPWQHETAERGMMLPSACVIIVRNGKVAAIRSKKHDGSLELPGGKAMLSAGVLLVTAEGLPLFESPETNAIRECIEEVGQVPWLRKLLFCSPCGGFMCSTFLATLPDHADLASGEEGEAGWFTPDEMLTGTYSEHTRQWLPMVFVARETSS